MLSGSRWRAKRSSFLTISTSSAASCLNKRPHHPRRKTLDPSMLAPNRAPARVEGTIGPTPKISNAQTGRH